ncbi:MAG: hypothetical protein IJ955_10300 [Oscillospiraceae bacterium]|nr:hypothetical protein [Oscillospiraceae bacterium]
MDDRITGELLSVVKNYVDITWSDQDTDAKLRGITARGMTFLDHIAGCELEYRENATETQLLLDYVRYVRAGAASDFAKDFQGELLALHFSEEVRAYADGNAE